jgi:hypothetical protein
MNCTKIDQLLGLYIYEELSEKENKIVETHLASCATCSMKVETFKKATAFLSNEKQEPKPLPDWDRSWQVIRNRMESQKPPKQERRGAFRPMMQWGWAGALAASVIIFVIGFFTGHHLQDRSLLFRSGPPVQQETMARVERDQRDYFLVELHEHIDNIKPVLLEYANYWRTPGTQGALSVEKEMVVNLLIQNQLLLCRLPSEDNRYMQQLLTELKVILTKIAALTFDDPESLSMIKKMIRKKGLLFKMEAVRPVSNGSNDRISL